MFAVFQALVSSAVLFALYRYLLTSQGIEALGIWALVSAASSLANVTNLGLAGGAVRFVSKYLARNDARSAAAAVETATLSIAATLALAALLLWPALEWLLHLVVAVEHMGIAAGLLPYTLMALWLNGIGAAIYSGLDGCHRADLRSIATIATQPLLLLLAITLVPRFDLNGLVYAQLLQAVVWLSLGWLLLKKQLPSLSSVPRRWSRKMLLEMWRFGLSFQLISILTVLAEPLAKGLLSHFGNVSAVGYYEMANRLVTQVRALLVSANHVLIPYYSKISETRAEEFRALYTQNLNAIVLLSTLAFSSLAALLPLIADLWIGRLEPQFLVFAGVLTGGWFVNTLGVPAYFANLGSGSVLGNLNGHLVQTVATIVIGLWAGMLGGTMGTAMAWPLALILGTLVIITSFHRAQRVPISVILSASNAKMIGVGAGIAISGSAAYLFLSTSFNFLSAVLGCVAALFTGWTVFFLCIPETRLLRRTLPLGGKG